MHKQDDAAVAIVPAPSRSTRRAAEIEEHVFSRFPDFRKMQQQTLNGITRFGCNKKMSRVHLEEPGRRWSGTSALRERSTGGTGLSGKGAVAVVG